MVGSFSVTRPAVSCDSFLIQRVSAQFLNGRYSIYELWDILAAEEFVIQPIATVIVSEAGI